MSVVTLLVAPDPDDERANAVWSFEHMMAHRQTFAAMSQLSDFSVLPYLLDPARGQNIPAGDWNKRHQQAHNDFNSDLPSNYADGYTLTTVTPPTVSATGHSTGTTSLAITGPNNTILIGSTVSPSGAVITAQQSGSPGGAGTYTTNIATTISGAISITHPPYQQGNKLDGGTFGIPQAQILLEGNKADPENWSWWTFVNHQQHYTANAAILPMPTEYPTIAGTPPGQIIASNPWWWADRAPTKFPFW